ncbi:hypothetical protein [Actinophytocola sp. NPDC049390]|uniref:hypothetical protein n=1 Tax=Actinophytocola sp. NPDC049390 TaxID=3363894 RepID=UPI0037B02D50
MASTREDEPGCGPGCRASRNSAWRPCRRHHAPGSAALFVAVFPANVWAVRIFWRRPLPRAAMPARLPLRVPLVTEALRARE